MTVLNTCPQSVKDGVLHPFLKKVVSNTISSPILSHIFMSNCYNCKFTVLLINQQDTHTHTHPFNGPFSRTTQVSQYQKGKTNLDFTE